jgi:hypothetical protein
MDIEKYLNPNVDKLIIDAHGVSANIYDAELDPLTCFFYGDGTVVIDCDGHTHIELSIKNLNTLRKLTKQADEYFDDLEFEVPGEII